MNSAADLRRIQSYLRAAAPRGREHAKIGPFLATYNRESTNPYLNYAIPDDDATPSEPDIDALVEAYRARNRKPRLEYVPSIAPSVEPALLAYGFTVEYRTPLMLHRATPDFVPTPDGIELVAAESDDDLTAAARVQWEAYAEEGPMPQRAADSLRRTLDAGGIVVLARDSRTGEPAGAGLCTGPHDATTELAAVGVRESFRRRGIAGAMTAWLTIEARRRRISNVFLMAQGAAEERIYARAGFESISEVLHISFTSA
jgi:N-acetylglutamate synthase-like GNAT family acetyltransferase